ncbi:unnamed protein product [Rotaria sordida]|uniref:DDE Tnp4 domain-containing protein n=1 Tax=Rotaria sordida TaxID=392033 RepID=A0A815IDX3_9BILA|nr:unnamed protein product [Rotaria sordida]CAF1367302.1 unnamed protein product [Rotaria sordida]CAF1609625.1 unnamed protein product [Rotaria sordida]CAF4067035.1 unnamed protein product [Rotaria sordida]
MNIQQRIADTLFCLHFVEQRPWSQWSRTDESCLQHTGHDLEQHYHAERYIATEFDLSPSTMHHILSKVVDILHSCVYPELISLPALMFNRTTAHGPEEHHKLVVDSTSIAVPQSDNSQQLHVPECYRGSVHDITILRESCLLEHVNDSVQIIADKGYVGEDYVVTTRKKLHGRELTDEDKAFNRVINSARAAVENINQRLKTYAILGGMYRGAIDDFDKITKIEQVVCALCNLN